MTGQKKQRVTCAVERINPDRAADLLGLNIMNRSENKKHTAFLAREMEEGNWLINGDSIRLVIDDDGKEALVDGQHRLKAIIQSGVTIDVVVVRGLSPLAFSTIDVNMRRTAGHALQVGGYKNGTGLGAALVLVDKFLSSNLGSYQRYSNLDILRLAAEHKDMPRSVRVGMRCKHILQPRVTSACHYLFSIVDVDAADLFFHRVATGVDLTAGSPVYVLRERLIKNQMSKAKLYPEYLMAITIKAWNAERAGKTIQRLHYYDGKTTERVEAFPSIL